MVLPGGAGKDVESGLGESFTSAGSKLEGDADAPSPFLTNPAPKEVDCVPCVCISMAFHGLIHQCCRLEAVVDHGARLGLVILWSSRACVQRDLGKMTETLQTPRS